MTATPNSILSETKKVLGIADDYTVFDTDILIHINSVFSTLNQLGIGPAGGYAITGEADTWDAFLAGDPNLNSVKSYMFLRVKLLFDPPATSFLGDAQKKLAEEMEWRLNTYREEKTWVAPTPAPSDDCGFDSVQILDGGMA